MKWVSSLSSLTSLFVEDGSILTADVAKALRQKCPSFNYLQYHCCEGPEADQQLAEFLRDLKPQSLQTFVIRSRNEVGNETFMALQQHSSFQKLCLMRLNPTALRSLHQLRHSLAITTLAIEGNDMVEGFGWLDYDNPADFEEVAEWLSKCASLRELLLARGSNATGLLLKIENNLGMIEDDSPVMELTSLNLDLIELNRSDFRYFIGNQPHLENLTMRIEDNLFASPDEFYTELAPLIGKLEKLKTLNTTATFTTGDVAISIASLEHLKGCICMAT